jgi:hypothetical protein
MALLCAPQGFLLANGAIGPLSSQGSIARTRLEVAQSDASVSNQPADFLESSRSEKGTRIRRLPTHRERNVKGFVTCYTTIKRIQSVFSTIEWRMLVFLWIETDFLRRY